MCPNLNYDTIAEEEEANWVVEYPVAEDLAEAYQEVAYQEAAYPVEADWERRAVLLNSFAEVRR
jgi:hypothetical protein